MTTIQLNFLRRLLDDVHGVGGYYGTSQMQLLAAIPDLLTAAEREAKLREALDNLSMLFTQHVRNADQWKAYNDARASLAEGGGQ